MSGAAPIATVLLAAGGSSRLGAPKQLVPFQDTTLVARAARAALDAALGPLFVVTGADAPGVTAEVLSPEVRVVGNDAWRKGIGTSIACGVREVRRVCPSAAAVILLTCDQPAVGAAHLVALAVRYRAGTPRVVASTYDGTAGTPALFDAALFDDLLALPADRGAKGLIERHRSAAGFVPLEGGGRDVDTPEDLAGLA